MQVYTHDSVRQTISEGKEPIEFGPVTIEDYVYIGAGVIVTRGVRIGHHSVIGAYSLVKQDIPPYSKAWGIPCTVRGPVVL